MHRRAREILILVSALQGLILWYLWFHIVHIIARAVVETVWALVRLIIFVSIYICCFKAHNTDGL